MKEGAYLKVLVTGANGFMGSHLVPHLRAAGHDVRAMVQPGTDARSAERTADEVVLADLRDAARLHEAVRGVDVVVHLAAIVSDYGPIRRYFAVNVKGLRDLVDASVSAGVSRFVFMSSLAVHAYHGHSEGDERTPADVRWLAYVITKRRGEQMVREADASGRIESVVIRPGLFPFGPNDRQNFTRLARSLRSGLVPLVDGGGASLCTAYIENLVEGIRLAATHPAARGRTYVLADGVRVTWKDLLSRIAVSIGAPPPRRTLPSGAALAVATAWETFASIFLPGKDPLLTRYRVEVAARDLYFSIGRARDELGYDPKVGLDEGIRRTAEWYLATQTAARAA
jgi:nucleoside-diphosphate-sugar epimerase